MPIRNILDEIQITKKVATTSKTKESIASPNIPEKNEYSVTLGATKIIRIIIRVGAKNGIIESVRAIVEFGSCITAIPITNGTTNSIVSGMTKFCASFSLLTIEPKRANKVANIR